MNGSAAIGNANGTQQAGTTPRGAFILFEGVDRSGKSTQAQRLVANLKRKGLDVELWRFPDRNTTIGHMIDNYLSNQADLDDRTIHLLFSANRWEKRAEMLSKLESGTTLVVDRYSYSGVAFTAAKGLPREWCEAPEVGLPAPDAVLYLRLTVDDAAQRGGYGAERYEKLEFQAKVFRLFEDWRQKHEKWITIDALQGMEDIEQRVLAAAEQVVEQCQAGLSLGVLWDGDSPGVVNKDPFQDAENMVP